MRTTLFLLLNLLAGCTKVSEEELKAKIDACTAAGINYTYLSDFRGRHMMSCGLPDDYVNFITKTC